MGICPLDMGIKLCYPKNMSRKDNAGVQVRKAQKEEFVKLARSRGTTQTKLFEDMLKLVKFKTRVRAEPVNVNPASGDGVIQADIITDEGVIVADIIN